MRSSEAGRPRAQKWDEWEQVWDKGQKVIWPWWMMMKISMELMKCFFLHHRNQMPVSSRQLLFKVVFVMFAYSPLNSNSMKSFTELSRTMIFQPARTLQCAHNKERKQCPVLGPQEGALSRGTGFGRGGLRKKSQAHKGKHHGGLLACPPARCLGLGYWQYEFTYHRKGKKRLVISEGFRHINNQNVLMIWKCRWHRGRNHFTRLERRKSAFSRFSLNWNTSNRKVPTADFCVTSLQRAQCQGSKCSSGIWSKKKLVG